MSIDQAHLPSEHIDELWEDIDTSMPQELTKGRRLPSPDRLMRQLNCPKLQDLATAAAVANAGLPLQSRAGTCAPDRHRNKKHEW